MAERKPMSKKLRFEVFKRDSFTCQYCGRMAPDVILEVDHINPVKERGTNSITNLITSCFDCNRGKGAKKLSDNQVIKLEQEQLKEINEKREQLKLLLKWKNELETFENEKIDIIDSMIMVCSDKQLSERGRDSIKKCIKKYGMSETIESTTISINQYHKGDDENIAKVINYIARICATRQKNISDPYYGKANYIKGILRNRINYVNEKQLAILLKEILVDEESVEMVTDFAKTAKHWTSFNNMIDDSGLRCD